MNSDGPFYYDTRNLRVFHNVMDILSIYMMMKQLPNEGNSWNETSAHMLFKVLVEPMLVQVSIDHIKALKFVI